MNIETKTINDLRTFVGDPNAGEFYYITDIGKEGEWYYAGDDIETLDNLGTVVTCPSITDPEDERNRKVFRRVYDAGFVNATWFGAIGNDDIDNHKFLQDALNFVSNIYNTNYLDGGGTVFLPKGIYRITKTLLIGQNCRLIGVNDRYHFYLYNNTSGGTVIKADFSLNSDQWVISSATYKINDPNLELLTFDATLNYNQGDPFYFDDYVYRQGISIENLTIDGGWGHYAFGGIRLSNAGMSTIQNVGVSNVKCGFMFNTCWGGTIDNSYANFDWYGALVICCNSALINNSYFVGTKLKQGYLFEIDAELLPKFIYNDPNHSYASWGLDDKVKYGKTGIYSYWAGSLAIIASVIEQTTNAITCLKSISNIISQYIEQIEYYGITIGVDIVTEMLVEQPQISGGLGAFYFGNGSMVIINSVACYNTQLYVYNNANNRNIKFSQVFISNGSRKYFPDIIFTDESVNGQNLGSVYIDPFDGNDDNYGFNKNDAVQTIDAALIRVQNQSTINPVKVIRIKDGATVLKDVTIKEIENCNLLITGYTDGGEGVSKPRIYFEVTNDIILIGGFKILGNVSLYFRNVDLICNPYYQLPTQLNQKTIFNLYHAYCKIVFDNLEIDLAHSYSLIKSLESNSSIETKFVDTNIIGTSNSSLSPSNNGIINILVDNSQIGSVLSPSIYSKFNTGWLDANTIRNNF